MRVKKFEAKTMKEALQMVKNELGPDAVILAARDNRKFGLAGETSVEVTAAVSESTLQRKKFAESRLTSGDRERFTNSGAKNQRALIDRMVDSRARQDREDEVAEQRRNHRITPVSYIDIPDEDEFPQARANRRDSARRENMARTGSRSELREPTSNIPSRQQAKAAANAQRLPISRAEVELAITARLEAERIALRSGNDRERQTHEQDENDTWTVHNTREAVKRLPIATRAENEFATTARSLHAEGTGAQEEPSAQAKARIRQAAKDAYHNNPFFDEDQRARRDAGGPHVSRRTFGMPNEGQNLRSIQAALNASERASERTSEQGGELLSARQTVSVDGRETELQTLRTEVSRLQQALDGFQKVPQTFATMHPGADFGIPFDFSFMFQKLTEAGITVDNTVEILQAAQKEIDPVQAKKRPNIDSWVARFFLSQVQINPTPFQGRVHLFTGGAGSGKTSTLVKIASQLVVRDKKRVAILSADSIKVGAVDQMKIYCQILNVPFAVVRNRKDWEWVLNQLGGMDHILVDFPGLQLRDLDEIHLLKSLLPPEGIAAQTHFCVSATSKDGDAYEIAKRYRVTDFNDVIVTNLDQSVQHGLIYNIQRKTGKPLHSFGIGNRIPEDIELASKERVLDLIFRLSKFKKETR